MSVKHFHQMTCDDCGLEVKTTGKGARPHGWGGPYRGGYSDFGEDYCPDCSRKRLEADWPEEVPMPVIGQQIYVPTSLYIDHGEDDVQGGLATINGFQLNPGCKNVTNRVMVTVAELPGRSYNYLLAMQEQDTLRGIYGERRAYPDPDINEHTGLPNRY